MTGRIRYRIVVAVLIAVAYSSLPVLSLWTDVPGNLQCTLFTYDYRGYPYYTSSIALGPWIWPMVSQLYKSTGMSNDEIRDMYEIVLAVCNNNWGEGSRFLFARVMPNSGDEGKAFWWPQSAIRYHYGRPSRIKRDL